MIYTRCYCAWVGDERKEVVEIMFDDAVVTERKGVTAYHTAEGYIRGRYGRYAKIESARVCDLNELSVITIKIG